MDAAGGAGGQLADRLRSRGAARESEPGARRLRLAARIGAVRGAHFHDVLFEEGHALGARQPRNRRRLQPPDRRNRRNWGNWGNGGREAGKRVDALEGTSIGAADGGGEERGVECSAKKYRKLAKRAAKVLHISGKRLGNYGNIVCFEPIGKRKLLLVERHLLDIAANLPKVVYRKRYGL